MNRNRIICTLSSQPFTWQQAVANGVTRRNLNHLLNNGSIEQIARGIYRSIQLGNEDLSEETFFQSATLRVKTPSAICLISALVHFELTDIIAKKTWVMVPQCRRTNYTDLKLLRPRNPHWSIGIEQKNGYSITTPERTIIDCLNYRTKIGSQIAIEALRRAVTIKCISLGKIMEMAIQLEVSHRILPYLEALSLMFDRYKLNVS